MSTPVPSTVIQQVERYVDEALASARKYSNSTPLDESGVYSLHVLAQSIYAAGWDDGCSAQAEIDRRRWQRISDRKNDDASEAAS